MSKWIRAILGLLGEKVALGSEVLEALSEGSGHGQMGSVGSECQQSQISPLEERLRRVSPTMLGVGERLTSRKPVGCNRMG